MTSLNILDNLVYGVFGEPFLFAVIIGIMFFWYAMKYDIPKWSAIGFYCIIGIWISYYYLPTWVLIIIIGFASLIAGTRAFRSTRV